MLLMLLLKRNPWHVHHLSRHAQYLQHGHSMPRHASFFQHAQQQHCRVLSTSSILNRFKTAIKDKEDGSRVRVSQKTGQEWISTIGLEIHAQIATRSKLFSGAGVDSRAPVNTQVALLDASTPGTLPALNRSCVQAGIKTALALNCTIKEVSTFDRKHYFYADLPAGYQITQQRKPLAINGILHFQVVKSSTVSKTYEGSAGIVQLQLEQDSGRSLHDQEEEKSLIDLNRCGTGLMEIVFEPDLFDGEEAAALIKELTLILLQLGTCTCQMEEGALRVDANISVHRPGEHLGTRTEVKNLNSIRSVVNAIEYEIDRQIQVISEGGIVENETRSFDIATKKTLTMRDKESKQDYRFMPEPNLPPLRLQLEGPGSKNILSIKNIRDSMPVLPQDTRKKLITEYNLTLDFAARFVNEPSLLNFLLEAIKLKPKNINILANLILNELEHWRSKKNVPLEKLPFKPEHFVRAADIKAYDILSHHLVKKALESILDHPEKYSDLDQVIKDRGWIQTFRDPKHVDQIVNRAIEENPKLVKKHVNGNVKALDLLFQTIVKKSYEIDMIMVTNRLKEKLEEIKSCASEVKS